jgi:hypothetical protein
VGCFDIAPVKLSREVLIAMTDFSCPRCLMKWRGGVGGEL